ncbi:hypothetical protein [Pedobacter steynii]
MSNPNYSISFIAGILSAKSYIVNDQAIITKLVIDSRSVIDPEESLFFALDGKRMGMSILITLIQMELRTL